MSLVQPARSIGIWELDEDGARYRRRSGNWPRWSEAPGFDLRADRPRVALFGESVARALFYDPAHTLAALVERGLDKRAEVVDLARTGGRIDQIQDLATQAQSLESEAVVLFAGNNWKYELARSERTTQARQEAAALADEGIAGLLRVRERSLAELARRTIHDFRAAFDPATRITVVIPESNLLDWQPRPLTPVLGDGREIEWLKMARRLDESVRAARWDVVVTIADEIHAWDGGISDGAYRAKGQALLELGSTKAALDAFRRARDVRLWSSTADPSWLPSAGAIAAREAAVEAGADVVDLTEILPRHSSRGVPGDELFADFCHLNSLGLALAASEITRRLSASLGIVAADTGSLPPEEWLAPVDIEAGANFCAALIGADFAQPLDGIRARARAARRIPEVADAMRTYCEAAASRAPWWMRAGQLSNVPTIRRFIEDVGWAKGYRYNERLFDAFAERSGAGSAAMASAESSRALPSGVRSSLLDPVFAPAWRPEGWEGLLDDTDVARHYFRSHEPLSTFEFRLAANEELEIEITSRLGPRGAASASVSLNGVSLGLLPLADTWQAHRLAANGRTGRNEIRIAWQRERFESTPYATAAHRLEQDLSHELHLIFGEIHSLHVTPQGDPGTRRERER